MARTNKDRVVVITGASSGIGRAAALTFAEEGAAVVLGARREGALREVVTECEARGGRALAVPTDVTDEGQVCRLADRALRAFGHIDVWVNNAAVSVFGRFEETPADAWRRVIETNLFGYVYGARVALPVFRERGRGVLINNASIVAVTGQPFASAYAVSKFGIVGLGAALREELGGAADIHVCTLLPATVDTPLFEHAGNYSGKEVRPVPPVIDPWRVARAITHLARSPQREAYVGSTGHLTAWQHRVAPGITERAFARHVSRSHFRDAPAPRSEGNVFSPTEGGTEVSGGWRSPPTRRRRRLTLAAMPLAAATLAVMGARALGRRDRLWPGRAPRR